jgi:hypothetical protein
LKEATSLISKFRDIGNGIISNPEDRAVELIKCVDQLSKLSESTQNRNLIFLSYVLNYFIEDVWSNIGVDSSYRSEMEDDDVKRILSHIGEGFVRLSDDIQNGGKGPYTCCTSLVELVSNYMGDIAYIKNKIEEGNGRCR